MSFDVRAPAMEMACDMGCYQNSSSSSKLLFLVWRNKSGELEGLRHLKSDHGDCLDGLSCPILRNYYSLLWRHKFFANDTPASIKEANKSEKIEIFGNFFEKIVVGWRVATILAHISHVSCFSWIFKLKAYLNEIRLPIVLVSYLLHRLL